MVGDYTRCRSYEDWYILYVTSHAMNTDIGRSVHRENARDQLPAATRPLIVREPRMYWITDPLPALAILWRFRVFFPQFHVCEWCAWWGRSEEAGCRRGVYSPQLFLTSVQCWERKWDWHSRGSGTESHQVWRNDHVVPHQVRTTTWFHTSIHARWGYSMFIKFWKMRICFTVQLSCTARLQKYVLDHLYP